MRGATITASTGWRHIGISTHAPLAGRDHNAVDRSHNVLISTHAPLAGRDFWGRLHRGCLTNFNPRAPCGARPAPHFGGVFSKKFQPTRPLRGATEHRVDHLVRQLDFNPRAPCGARRRGGYHGNETNYNFNPRAPCGARPQSPLTVLRSTRISTHAPLAGRDCRGRAEGHLRQISTHAPLAGRDRLKPRQVTYQDKHFNPRAPCGARRLVKSCLLSRSDFNPRAPCGARHSFGFGQSDCTRISTHAPLAGRDGGVFSQRLTTTGFQPTRPLRGATAKVYKSLCTFLR